MTKQEFDAIVAESVKAGANKAEAKEYVVSGFHLPVDDKGKPVFEQSAASGQPSAAKPSRKKAAAK